MMRKASLAIVTWIVGTLSLALMEHGDVTMHHLAEAVVPAVIATSGALLVVIRRRRTGREKRTGATHRE